MAKIIMLALVLKLVGGVVRYAAAFDFYGGKADATAYHLAGVQISEAFRHGHFAVDLGGRFVGTGFLNLFTGVVYTLIGPTKLGGFLVFSWLGFWGLYLCYRAFRIGCPEGNARRYAALVFFLPSLLFWPSGIGKDAWMIFAVGLSAYGAARVLAGARGGFLALVLGLTASSVVRPHVAALMVGSLAVAYLFRRTARERRTALTPVVKGAGALVMVAITLVVALQAQSYLHVDSLSGGVGQALNSVQQQSSQGHSQFSVGSNPVSILFTASTLLFRPFPWEAGSVQALGASAEGIFMFWLVIRSRRRIRGALRSAFRRPYVAFSLFYLLGFLLAFSRISNFGIVARERVQVIPFALVFLAMPAALPKRALTWQERARVGRSSGPFATVGQR